MKALEQLKAGGYNVEIAHYRLAKTSFTGLGHKNGTVLIRSKQSDRNSSKFLARGGKTVVTVTSPQNKIFTGVAFCHPNDNYCKREGILQALKKVFK
jgi:hypothetical protein